MPASMISEATGGRVKVSGNSIPIATSGLMPGSTPISVPSATPSEAVRQVLGREGDAEAEGEVREDVHQSPATSWNGSFSA